MKTCFEINPLYQFLSRSSGREDARLSVGAILQGLKMPVSLGWDFGGLLGQDSCYFDLVLMVMCSNWSLKELKLCFLHSIEYAAGTEGEKVRIRRKFDEDWIKWINSYLGWYWLFIFIHKILFEFTNSTVLSNVQTVETEFKVELIKLWD